MDETPLATIRTYQDLIEALRARAQSVGATGDDLDWCGGLPAGYARKLLAHKHIRSLNRISFGAVIGALGVKLLMVVDEEMWSRMSARITPTRLRKWNASAGMRPRRKTPYLGNSQWAIAMNHRRTLALTANQRRRIARKAAVIRWRNQSGSHSKAAP